ncbi:MAG: glycosyltransferase 87 family protein [Candidatus Hinthialibacter sp.]
MDDHQHGGVRLWRLPGGLLVSVIFAVFWLPFYDAAVHGQVTPILTGILALGMGRTPFQRGLLTGLAAALKPTFVLLIPFVSLSFGWRALGGCLLTASLGLLPLHLFADYLELLPELTRRAYGDIGLVRLLGARVSIICAMAASLWIALRWRGKEESYMGIIAMVVLSTALWFHAYTPLVLPAVYFSSKVLNQRLSKT